MKKALIVFLLAFLFFPSQTIFSYLPGPVAQAQEETFKTEENSDVSQEGPRFCL